MENLAHLDVSYNRLKKIDDKIINLRFDKKQTLFSKCFFFIFINIRNLKTLNYEGNELEYLPCSMLAMESLEQINVKNNYLHPLIWRRFLVKRIPVILLNLTLSQ